MSGPFLERVQFFDGQRLLAADLQGLEAQARELRWLHNRSLHQPGVGNGYAVTGKKGDKAVTIYPGYAIDALGREIVLTGPLQEPVPPLSDDGTGKPIVYDLTVSYRADGDLDEVETRDGVCLPRGVTKLREAPIFCWNRLGDDLRPVNAQVAQDIQAGMKLLLARAEVFHCALNRDLSIAQRRNARPPELPRVACGETDPATTPWQLWEEVGTGELATTTIFGLTTLVDTSAAGFRVTPRYTAQVLGERAFPASTAPGLFFDGLVDVVGEQPGLFTLRVLMPQGSVGALVLNPSDQLADQGTKSFALLRQAGWRVAWLGVEG
jgi:hypothetical protein